MNHEVPFKQIIEAALSSVGTIADVNTVVGDPIIISDTVTIVPFSKVTVGFASGGSEFGKDLPAERRPNFGGANGAGVSVVPLGFIAIENGSVRLLDLGIPESYFAASDPVNRALDGINGVIEKAPALVAKIKELIDSFKSSADSDGDIEPVSDDGKEWL